MVNNSKTRYKLETNKKSPKKALPVKKNETSSKKSDKKNKTVRKTVRRSKSKKSPGPLKSKSRLVKNLTPKRVARIIGDLANKKGKSYTKT